MSSAFYSFINSITNSVTSRYDIKHQISSSGLWKIYQGERKTTGQKVALFIFEKKALDISFKRDRKNESDQVYELLKKEASNLARLRHPSILEVVEPVNESRSSIVFVTEPLMGSLTHLVKHEHHTSDSLSLDLDELEIQKGLLQIGKGLQFLNDANVVHHNLTTDAIFVNAKGDWKIGGLGHGVFLNAGHTTESQQDYLPDACQINLDYAAPEYVLDNNVCQANDMFSLGCLAYAVHNKGQSLLKTFNSFHTYEKQVKALASQSFQSIPSDLQPVIRSLLTLQPNQRMNPTHFQNSHYFDNLLVSTMKFLESFPEKTREEKAQFMKGLARVLGQFPERVLKRKILHSLLEELKDHQLLPYTIPNIFIITQKLSQQEFCDLVLPSLKPVFSVRDPPQNMIVLLEKLDVLQQKTPREIFRDDVMPLVYAALEAPTSLVQERALRIIPSLAESLDYTAVKSSLFPRVQTLFVQTTILSVKVSTLICFHSMIKVLDKFTIQEKLVPVLKNIKTKEPAVMLATLAVYDEVGKVADKEIIATEILPQLWRMSFGPLLNLEQFQKFMKTIRDLTNRVEEAHVKHLREVKSLEEQTKSVSASASPQITSSASPMVGDTEVSFESLVKGGGGTVASDPFGAMTATPVSSQPNNNNNTLWTSNQEQKLNHSSWTAPQTNTLQPNINTLSPIQPNTNTWSSSQHNIMSIQHNTLPIQSTTTTNSWSSSSQPAIQPLASPPSHLQPPPPLNNTQPNYSALRPVSNQTNNHSVMALSSGMSLLMPTSSVNTGSPKPPHTQLNKANLHAFDPLG